MTPRPRRARTVLLVSLGLLSGLLLAWLCAVALLWLGGVRY